MSTDPTSRFRTTAERVLDALLETDPVTATRLGDHQYDAQLADLSTDGVTARLSAVTEALAALDSIDEAPLDAEDVVDLEMLRNICSGEQWAIAEVRQIEWDPLPHLPGNAIYSLIAREAADPEQRARDLASRLRAVPRVLDVARETLHDMPLVHVETAISQARGVRALLGADVDALVAKAPSEQAAVDEARTQADQAIAEFAAWLADELPAAQGNPRLGPERYAARLWFALDTETDADALLTRAESDLMAVEEEITATSARIGSGGVRATLDMLADEAPITNATILSECERLLAECTDVVRQADWMTITDDAVSIIEMPESRRGIAVAYCDQPGALEPEPLPTFFAVSPTPSDWSADRVASFYREYNGNLLRDLVVHEAMPGHALQLAHARRFEGSTPTRAAFYSNTFVEGWAVYAEELVATCGPDAETRAGLALRMQQLKMALRMIINTILDIRVHSREMTEREAMQLMIKRGHQEEGEAAGKWRRALLTAGQLPTYYTGYTEVRQIVRDLAEAHPGWPQRQLHDAVLAHGSPAPRYLRTLLRL